MFGDLTKNKASAIVISDMRIDQRSLTIVAVLVAFFSMAVLCCCVVKRSVMSVKKLCAHCPLKADADANSHECCFSKLIPMELAKQSSVLPLLPVFFLTIVALLLLRPAAPFAYRSIYSNGPPGHLTTVPIYLRSRNIRI